MCKLLFVNYINSTTQEPNITKIPVVILTHFVE